MDLDRHPATVSNKVRIATWNVRTLYQPGKLENVKQEMKRLKVNVMGVCETRWTDSGSFTSDGFTVLFSGNDKHERGVGFIIDQTTEKSIIGFWPLSDIE